MKTEKYHNFSCFFPSLLFLLLCFSTPFSILCFKKKMICYSLLRDIMLVNDIKSTACQSIFLWLVLFPGEGVCGCGDVVRNHHLLKAPWEGNFMEKILSRFQSKRPRSKIYLQKHTSGMTFGWLSGPVLVFNGSQLVSEHTKLANFVNFEITPEFETSYDGSFKESYK